MLRDRRPRLVAGLALIATSLMATLVAVPSASAGGVSPGTVSVRVEGSRLLVHAQPAPGFKVYAIEIGNAPYVDDFGFLIGNYVTSGSYDTFPTQAIDYRTDELDPGSYYGLVRWIRDGDPNAFPFNGTVRGPYTVPAAVAPPAPQPPPSQPPTPPSNPPSAPPSNALDLEFRRIEWKTIDPGGRGESMRYRINATICSNRRKPIVIVISETAGFVRRASDVFIRVAGFEGCRRWSTNRRVDTRFWFGGQYQFSSIAAVKYAGSQQWQDSAQTRFRHSMPT